MKGCRILGVVRPIWIKFVTGDLHRKHLMLVTCVIHFGQYFDYVK
jgi:hypothetical protein